MGLEIRVQAEDKTSLDLAMKQAIILFTCEFLKSLTTKDISKLIAHSIIVFTAFYLVNSPNFQFET